MRASRLGALDGEAEGDDAVRMAAPARALVVGVHGNRHRGARRASAGGEDENEQLRRWRPSHVDYFGTEIKDDAANLSMASIWVGSSKLDGIVLGRAAAMVARSRSGERQREGRAGEEQVGGSETGGRPRSQP